LRVLITNNALDRREGTELYVRDLALGLRELGHSPVAYSPVLGEVAEELRQLGIPVERDLDAITVPPDVIHGHHHFEAMTALLRFRSVPALFVCHGWQLWLEAPPVFPRVHQYVAVSSVCRDRLVHAHAIPEHRVHVLLNFVDLRRFASRGELPVRPRRALVFSNHASELTHLPAVRNACARMRLDLDVVGIRAGRPASQPEILLRDYDLVFAQSRAALEAMAVGAAVVLCDHVGVGPMVTTAEMDLLRPLNFGPPALRPPIDPEALVREISRYDRDDATAVSRRIRDMAGLDAAAEAFVELYRRVIAEQHAAAPVDLSEEGRAAAAYLRRVELDVAAGAAPTLRWRGGDGPRRDAAPLAQRVVRWLS
jgi:glycosyltransferase involved in cell wall biosynthesis